MPSIGPTELIIVLAIVLIIFGVGRLPDIGGALGKSIREFRQASSDDAGKVGKAKPREAGKEGEPEAAGETA